VTDSLRKGRAVHLVSGYLPIDRPSREAGGLRLNRRFAAAIESFRACEVDAVFDSVLYGALVVGVARALEADSFRVEVGGNGDRRFTNIEALERELVLLSKDDDPPARVTMYAGGPAVALAEVEPYVNVGGPMPYHDTYTVAFYCGDASINRVVDAVRKACMATDAHVESESEGDPTPLGGGRRRP
jgi:hypothetical protein